MLHTEKSEYKGIPASVTTTIEQTDHTPEEVVQKYFAAFADGNVEAMLACLDEDVVWHIDGALTVPTVGLLHGKEQVKGWLRRFPKGFTPQQFSVDKLMTDAEDVIAVGYFRHLAHLPGGGVHTPRKRFVGRQFVINFKVRNGKIVLYHIYEDSLALSRTFALDDDWDEQEVLINGVRYAFSDTQYTEVEADKPVVVFAHGLFMDRTIFDVQVRELSKQYRCLAFDMPGHSQSGYNRKGWSLEEAADDFALLIKEMQLGAVAFVGQSQGGMVGIHLAARHPELVSRLVLMGTSAKKEPADRIDTWRRLRKVLFETSEKERDAAFSQVQQRVKGAQWFTAHPEEARAERAVMLRHNRRGITLALDAAVLNRPDITHLFSSITVPTLILCGAEDTATPPAMSRELASGVTGSALIIVHGAGHHLPLESPAQTTNVLLSFIQ